MYKFAYWNQNSIVTTKVGYSLRLLGNKCYPLFDSYLEMGFHISSVTRFWDTDCTTINTKSSSFIL